jgi:DNA polymerase (family 10)
MGRMDKPITNRQVAHLFSQVAEMLSIRGDSIHRILAYRRAAEEISALGEDINQITAAEKLTDIPYIGKTLAEKIVEILETGELDFFNRLAEEIPPSLVELLRVEGVGPKRVKQLYEHLGIATISQLQAAAAAGKLSELPGLGKKTEEKLLRAIAALEKYGDDRTPIGEAWPFAQEILAQLAVLPGVTKTAVAGSLRRGKETIGDVDLLVASAEPEAVMEAFCALSNIESVAARGRTKSRVVLLNGLGVDLRVLPAARWGTLLSYFHRQQGAQCATA